MSGHSKWSQIKRQKGVADAKRGQIFTRLGREIAVAVKEGGGNAETNYRLRLAILKAKDNNMPLENIDRAIKRALGEKGGSSVAELTYEGYGPGGVAIMVEAMTDNRNRTSSEVRSVFTKHGGSLAEVGSVSWLFETRGVIFIDAEEKQGEEWALEAIDAGAEDVKVEKSFIEVRTSPEKLEEVRKALEEKHIPIASAEIARVPKSVLLLEDKVAWQALRLLDRLEELEDVQRLFSNSDFSESVLQGYREGLR